MIRRMLVLMSAMLLTVALVPAGGAAQPGPPATADEVIPGHYIVVLEDDAHPGAVAADHAQANGADIGNIYEHALNGYSARLPDQAIERITADPRVRYVTPDREVHALHHQCGHSGGRGDNNEDVACDDGHVSGTVFDASGDVVEGATVTIDDGGPEDEDWSATTGTHGSYTIEDVGGAAEREVVATRDDASDATVIQVDGDVSGVDLVLELDDDADTDPIEETYTVSGSVSLDDDGDLSTVDVTVTLDNGDTSATADASDDGSYAFEDVEEGTYTVEADAQGYDPASANITVDGEDVSGVNLVLEPTSEDDDADEPDVETVPWGVERTGSTAVHGEHTGEGVSIFIIDSGIESDHPDLAANLSDDDDSHFATDDATCTESSGGPRGGPFATPDVECDTEWDDDNGHGTHVAGTAAATPSGELLGVAPDATLHAVKVLASDGGGSWSGVIAGVDHVTKQAKDNGAPVVANMSLGGGGGKDGVCTTDGYSDGDDALYEAICNATNAGVVFAVAAGNDDDDAANSVPAAYTDAVITVSATTCELAGSADDQHCQDGTDDWAGFSNHGDAVTIAAPGTQILSTYLNGDYDVLSGTSMASPHVAGAAALLVQAGLGSAGGYDAFTEIQDRLVTTAEDTTSWPDNEDHDEGFLDVAAAIANL